MADGRGSPVTRDDNQLDPDEGPSTSRNVCGLDCQGELSELGRSQSDSDRGESSSDESCTESNTTPKSRKRVRKPRRWKKNVRIRLRNSGKKYTSAPGKEVLTTYFNNYFHIKHYYTVCTLGCCPNDSTCGCSLRCGENLTSSERRLIFDGLWSTENFDVQNAYLCGCVKVLQVARRYSPKGAKSRRQNTRVFYVKKGAVSVRACKKMFLKMHGISDGRLERALKAQQAASGSLHCDQRGRHEPGNKTKSDTVDNIKVHIKAFPDTNHTILGKTTLIESS